MQPDQIIIPDRQPPSASPKPRRRMRPVYCFGLQCPCLCRRAPLPAGCYCTVYPQHYHSRVMYTCTVSTDETAQNLEDVKAKLPPEYQEFLDVFDRAQADKLPPHRSYDHKIELTSAPYKLQKVKEYLNENLSKGFITPSKAPYSSPVLFTLKANEDLRFCVDYRKLNAITKRNRYPLPLIDEVIGKIVGCKHLTRLDIISAFNKLRMHPDSEDYTTFITALGAYKSKVLPFGLTNDPASFQQCMNDVL